VRQGDPGNVMYFVAEGRLEVRLYSSEQAEGGSCSSGGSRSRRNSLLRPGSPGKASDTPRPRSEVDLDLQGGGAADCEWLTRAGGGASSSNCCCISAARLAFYTWRCTFCSLKQAAHCVMFRRMTLWSGRCSLLHVVTMHCRPADATREKHNSWQNVMLAGLTEHYHVLGHLGPGEHFGEYSCLLGECRTATVVASEHVELYSLSRESVEKVGVGGVCVGGGGGWGWVIGIGMAQRWAAAQH
jgi:CRP-like cAMP-binding protein